jgi:hypothetical protein
LLIALQRLPRLRRGSALLDAMMGAPGLDFETWDPSRKCRQTNLESYDQIDFSCRLSKPLSTPVSEGELGRELHQARSGRTDDLAEMRVLGLAVNRRWPIKLCVIERVESLQPEFQ